jgi:hypothetical protein
MENEQTPSPMSLGTNLNTPAPDVNQATTQGPGGNERGQQRQQGQGEPSFGLNTAATRLREWSAARMTGAARPARSATELPSPGHQNPLFGSRTPLSYGDPYCSYGPTMRAPMPPQIPMQIPMHAPMHTPMHMRPPPPTPQGVTPFSPQTPYQQAGVPVFQPAQWAAPAPTYKKRYDAPPGFSGAGSRQRSDYTVSVAG